MIRVFRAPDSARASGLISFPGPQMIGWWIVISTQLPHERDNSETHARRSSICVQWEVGAGGVAWLASLVTGGKARKLSGSGYPNRYVAAAGDVFSVIGLSRFTPGLEQEIHLPGERHEAVQINWARVWSCTPETQLTIDAWDRS